MEKHLSLKLADIEVLFFFLFRFSEFSLNGLKLSKTVVDGICHLAKTSCLSRLMLEGTAIGTVSNFHVTMFFMLISVCLVYRLSFFL